MACNYLPLRTLALTIAGTALLNGCVTESHRSIEPPKTLAARSDYQGPKGSVFIASFDNRSAYLRGLFSDGVDRLGGQAKTILIGHLQETGRFQVMERDNLEATAREAKLAGKAPMLIPAAIALTGDVSEFGRKEVGDQQLFGILGSGKKQIAYAKVTLNVVDSLTSQVIYSVSGAGEYALSQREVLGFGSTAGYDATLNGKVLDLAIREATDKLVAAAEQGALQPKLAAQ